MKGNNLYDNPPPQIWLTHKKGQHHMIRTEPNDPGSVRYVLGSDYDELLKYIERMVGGIESDPVSALNEIRFALGDNGKRSIPELIEFAKELRNQHEHTE